MPYIISPIAHTYLRTYAGNLKPGLLEFRQNFFIFTIHINEVRENMRTVRAFIEKRTRTLSRDSRVKKKSELESIEAATVESNLVYLYYK